MTDQAKEFIKKVNSDQALYEKFKALVPEDQKDSDREAIISDKIVPFAKEAGYDLSAEDFKTDGPASGEISDEELEAVAGGGGCLCEEKGAGMGADDYTNCIYFCGCTAAGVGEYSGKNCMCTGYGEGWDGARWQ